MSNDKPELFFKDELLLEPVGGNLIFLAAQSPFKLHFFWYYHGNPFDTLQRAFPELAGDYRLVVELLDDKHERVASFETFPGTAHWFDVSPDSTYTAIVGFFSEHSPFIRLMTSQAVSTPRSGISNSTDPSQEFSLTTREFAKILALSGALRDAFSCALEAADQEEREKRGLPGLRTREVAEKFSKVPVPALETEEDLRVMRRLLSDLAFARPYDELLSRLDMPFSGWLSLTFIRRKHRHQQKYIQDAAQLLQTLQLILYAKSECLPDIAARDITRTGPYH